MFQQIYSVLYMEFSYKVGIFEEYTSIESFEFYKNKKFKEGFKIELFYNTKSIKTVFLQGILHYL